MKSYNILGVNICITNMEDTINKIVSDLRNLKGKYICVCNVHTTVMAFEDKRYREFQNSAYLNLPDGKPLSVICRLKGYKECDRVTGPDLMEEIFKISEKNEYTHFFYGSKDETLRMLKENIQKRYPAIKIVGCYSPPYVSLQIEEDEVITNMINCLKPDFLWVGLGAPKQEKWMYEHCRNISSLMIGIGAGVDYHAKILKRAPKWMQNAGMEWLYRLFQEPKRLFIRYFTTNIKFIVYYILFKKKFYKVQC